jgi:Peptidase A4 family
MRRALILLAATSLVAALASATGVVRIGPGAADPSAAGVHRGAPIAVLGANHSTNWFGYNQGTLERGGTMFHAITGSWTVPAASEHRMPNGSAPDEYSSTWIGIGGGCVDAKCSVGDNTLIQTGTEQDVVGGKPQYSAWWELIPAPSIGITMTVRPGDHMHADIHEFVGGSEAWSITLTDVTRHETFNQTASYSSSHATAEWIEETPLVVGTNGGFATLPTLTPAVFDPGTVNGGSPHLKASEEILLTSSNGKVYSVPSAPDRDTDGFTACAWATSCAAPAS